MALTRAVALAQPACPESATLTIVARNVSGVSPIDVTVDGEHAGDDPGCPGAGATSYHRTLRCTGSGVVRCGLIEGLQPGPWIHRLAVTVPGSAPQVQAQRLLLLGGAPTDVSNALVWTIYPRTFVVPSSDPIDLQAQLDQAAMYTEDNEGPVLVTFATTAFPGAADPKRIYLVDPTGTPPCTIAARNHCPPSATVAAPTAGLCFTGDRIVVDALDRDARPGGVILSVGVCETQTVRLYGGSNVLRGLVVEGSQAPNPRNQLDSLAITDGRAFRNRLEQALIVGPTHGDAVSVGFGAGRADDAGPGDNVISESEITGAEDKGVKVVDGGVVRIERSCLHDNFNGGVQLTTSDPAATQGGSAVALENVVQHNVGGGAQHGFIVGVEEKQIETHIQTRGNVVRFNGTRGISVANGATADLADDVVTDNYQAGLRIRSLKTSGAPNALLRGSALVCNYAPGYCVDTDGKATGAVCRENADCGRCVGGTSRCRKDADCPSAQPCRFDDCNVDFCDPQRCGTGCCADSSVATGIGLGLDQPCDDCATPMVDLGSGVDAGRNAFTLNTNPNASGPDITRGFNVTSALVTSSSIPAAGNQWEHCGDDCDAAEVLQNDIRLIGEATLFDLGLLGPPSAGPRPEVTAISSPRPRAGDLVRVYGGPFNAIDGTACHPAGLPDDPCSAENPNVVAKNASDVARGNRVIVTLNGVAYDAPVHQVTPSMLMFAMPVDCTAAGTLTVARGTSVGTPAVLCDPKGCGGQPAGWPCEDGNACTVDDHCDAESACLAGGPLVCDGPCLTCDPASGCVPKPATALCDDGSACTTGDHCSGDANTCVLQGVLACTAACLSGTCDAGTGCVPKPEGSTCREAAGPCDVVESCTGSSGDCRPDGFAAASASCDDGNACTEGDHCSGTASVCAGAPVLCDDPCLTGVCDPGAGCVLRDGAGALTCRVGECRKARLTRKARKLALLIDHAIDRGKLPRARRVQRLERLLERCGVSNL